MAKKKTKKFGAETAKVLQLVIHSLYKNKDIFLRELISNASDACDKFRFESQRDASLAEEDLPLRIKISMDEENKILSISDTGIGMNEEDLIANLGTIAKSGTQEFAATLEENNDNNLIGQFGVGFYSAFMVADEIEVKTKKAGDEQAYIWKSKGDGQYTVAELEGEEFFRGTRINLKLRDGMETYLDKHRLTNIVKTYSDHISIPVLLTDEEGKEEQINAGTAIWMRPKSEITDEQYSEFYKTTAHQYDEPFMRLHGKAEGAIEYNYLLFIPSTKPFDLFHPDRARRLKLFVKRVFIAEDEVDVIPRSLRFLRGVIDSEDLPLNVSRETLQDNPILEKIRNAVTNKVLSELKKKSEKEPEEYLKFWANFGAVLKEGLCEMLEGRDKIFEICKFNSSKQEAVTSLDEYLERADADQKEIYYLAGENLETMKTSPQIEGFVKRGIEVLLLNDSVDNFWLQVGPEYKGKKFKSVTNADINFDEEDENQESGKENQEENDKLVEMFKAELGDKVKDVRISKKLESTPVCLAIADGDMDMKMEKFLREQKQLPNASAKILEINPNHELIKSLGNASDVQEANNLINLLFDQAMIQEGENIADIKGFSDRLGHFLKKAMAA